MLLKCRFLYLKFICLSFKYRTQATEIVVTIISDNCAELDKLDIDVLIEINICLIATTKLKAQIAITSK